MAYVYLDDASATDAIARRKLQRDDTTQLSGPHLGPREGGTKEVRSKGQGAKNLGIYRGSIDDTPLTSFPIGKYRQMQFHSLRSVTRASEIREFSFAVEDEKNEGSLSYWMR